MAGHAGNWAALAMLALRAELKVKVDSEEN